MADIQEKFTKALYRMNCPDSMELGEYHLTMLPKARAEFIKRHLAECPHCTREVSQLQDYLKGLAPELEVGSFDRVKERVRILVALLLSDEPESGLSGKLVQAPAIAGVRGEIESPFIYQAGEVQVIIKVSDDAQQSGRKTILGLVTGMRNPQVWNVHLWRANQQLSTVPVDDLGNFVIPDLVPADYELILSGPEIEIHIQNLELGAQ